MGLRAINIGYALGYRDFHLFGFDGCIKGDIHAYPQPENLSDIGYMYWYNGNEYHMTSWMVEQAQNFSEFMENYGDTFRLKVHSEGVIKHIGETQCQQKIPTQDSIHTHL